MAKLLNLVLLIGVASFICSECRLLAADKRIAPELQPKSDDKFFGKDYPADERPTTVQHPALDHPYPAVQDHQDYDKDYVKDENSDNGEWKTQMAYDELRRSLNKEKREMEEAKAALDKAKKELDAARAADKNAQGTADGTEKTVAEKKAAAEKAGDRLDDATDKVRSEGGSVGDALKEVEDDEMTLEECKKKLKKVHDELDKIKSDESGALAREAAAEAARVKAEGVAKGSDKSLADLKADTAKQLQELNDAKADLKKEQADLDKHDAEMKAAISKVNAYREKADKDGGVYPEKKKSGAATTLPALVAMLAVAAGYLL